MVRPLIVYLHPNVVVRVGWEPSATNDSFAVLYMKDNSHKISKASMPFLEATMHVSRVQSRVRESAGFVEGAHVENIDAVRVTEMLEMLSARYQWGSGGF